MTMSSSAIQAPHPWRYWLALTGSFGYTLVNWLIPSFYGLWPIYIVAIALLFTIQWWLVSPHPDGLHWIIGSIAIFIIGLFVTGFWLQPTLYAELTSLRQTLLPTLTSNTVLIICGVLIHGILGLMVGVLQSLLIPIMLSA
ncbi:MAG: hypothetical protein LCH85_20600 [Chloroflexi bacterium]|nr:hypothetical protein [Chloroflexota bacterium]